MTTRQLKTMIRETFPTGERGKIHGIYTAIQRFIFLVLLEGGHAAVNILRETLRAMGAPDAPHGKRNWADELSRWGTVTLTAFLILWLISIIPVDPDLFIDD